MFIVTRMLCTARDCVEDELCTCTTAVEPHSVARYQAYTALMPARQQTPRDLLACKQLDGSIVANCSRPGLLLPLELLLLQC
jgi:hypothetical protein